MHHEPTREMREKEDQKEQKEQDLRGVHPSVQQPDPSMSTNDNVDGKKKSGGILLKKYVSVRFPRQAPMTFGIAAEQHDKYAVVLFAVRGHDVNSRMRSYFNVGLGDSRARAFGSAKNIITQAKEASPDIKKVYGILAKTYIDADSAEKAERGVEKQFVHELL